MKDVKVQMQQAMELTSGVLGIDKWEEPVTGIRPITLVIACQQHI